LVDRGVIAAVVIAAVVIIRPDFAGDSHQEATGQETAQVLQDIAARAAARRHLRESIEPHLRHSCSFPRSESKKWEQISAV
jgi:hypothetical protein